MDSISHSYEKCSNNHIAGVMKYEAVCDFERATVTEKASKSFYEDIN